MYTYWSITKTTIVTFTIPYQNGTYVQWIMEPLVRLSPSIRPSHSIISSSEAICIVILSVNFLYFYVHLTIFILL